MSAGFHCLRSKYETRLVKVRKCLAHNSLRKGGRFEEGEETVCGTFSRFYRNTPLTCQVQAIRQIYSSNDLRQERN